MDTLIAVLAIALLVIGFAVLPPLGGFVRDCLRDRWRQFVAEGGLMGWIMRRTSKAVLK